MTAPQKRRFAVVITATRAGRIRTLAGASSNDIALFRITDYRAGLIAARVLCTQARHARIGSSLFVPGVPEADTDEAALDALIRWHDRVAAILTRRLPAGSWKNLRNAA